MVQRIHVVDGKVCVEAGRRLALLSQTFRLDAAAIAHKLWPGTWSVRILLAREKPFKRIFNRAWNCEVVKLQLSQILFYHVVERMVEALIPEDTYCLLSTPFQLSRFTPGTESATVANHEARWIQFRDRDRDRDKFRGAGGLFRWIWSMARALVLMPRARALICVEVRVGYCSWPKRITDGKTVCGVPSWELLRRATKVYTKPMDRPFNDLVEGLSIRMTGTAQDPNYPSSSNTMSLTR